MTTGTESPGLVVLLEHAGRTIAGLEARVDQLVEQVAAEQEERRRLEELLAQLVNGAQPDTSGVRPPQGTGGETSEYDLAAHQPRPTAP